jgi:hypothetical protein
MSTGTRRSLAAPSGSRPAGGVAEKPSIELRIGDVSTRITGDTDVAYVIAKLIVALRA